MPSCYSHSRVLTDAVPKPPRFTLPADAEYIGGEPGRHDADADSAVPRLPVDRQTQKQNKQTEQAGGQNCRQLKS